MLKEKGVSGPPKKMSTHSQAELCRTVTSRGNETCADRERAWEDLKSLGEGLSLSVIEGVAQAASCRGMREEAQALLSERRQKAKAVA